jgi:Uri superfamily endonuclease
MNLPTSDDLKAKLPQKNQNQEQSLKTLRSNLKLAYSLVAKANTSSHQNNKRYYDRKTKPRFEIDYLTCLYNPAIKPGLTTKCSKPWHGPYHVTKIV